MVSIWKIGFLFFRLGALGFGGPLALIALMEQECVHQKKWISRKRFEETFVFCKMLPGPIAYQMALWVGYELRGRLGGLVAGISFVLPAASLLFLFAKFYSDFQDWGSSQWVLDGMRVGALVVILQSVGSLFSPYRKKLTSWTYAILGAFFMMAFPRWEPVIILLGGVLSVFLLKKYPVFRVRLSSLSILFSLFWVHFKAGAFVFGTGLAIVPVLEREAVGAYQWLTKNEFLDALAFGQVTPGPVTTVAAFIGYKAALGMGSLVATFGMYLPGALMILFILPWFRKKIEGKNWLIDFQLGAVPTVIGCLSAAAFGLVSSSLNTSFLKGTFLFLLLVQVVKPLPPWLIILLGVLIQFLTTAFLNK
jgi:chromate transporter